MSATEVRAASSELTWSDPARGWRRLRVVLIVAALVLTAVGGLLGERPATLATLERQVASGEVDVVRVIQGLGPTGRGAATVEAHWRIGLRGYWVEVVEARPRRAAHEVASNGDVPVITRDLASRLTELQPGLRIEPMSWPNVETEFFGWRLPGWFGWLLLPTALAVLALLVAGPRPWRATRWAWFWLMALPPGVFAFLLLGGPTRGLPAPSDDSRRLTGGWAFLLAIVLGGAFRPDR